MTSAHQPIDHPAATPLLRWISDLMCLSALCSHAKCRRACACCGEPRKCLARYAPLVPEDAREGVKAMIEGRLHDFSFFELRDDCPDVDELLAWRELVHACAARGR